MEHRGGNEPIPLAYILPGLATYAVAALDTLSLPSSVGVKLWLLGSTDLISAVFWPLAWVAWLTTHFAGMRTPIQTVLGIF